MILPRALAFLAVATAVVTLSPRALAGRVQIDSSRPARLNYGYPDWNRDPRKVDGASLLMREGKTGKIVQIALEETAPDSSIFSGRYKLNWKDATDLAVEFYTPDQSLFQSKAGLDRISTMIAKGELPRKPFLMHRAPRSGDQIIDLYDTKEQAQDAIRAFRAEAQAVTLKEQRVPTDAEMDAAALALAAREREATARAMADRVRQDQIEAQKAAERAENFRRAQENEKAERRSLAKANADQAMSAYANGDFATALTAFQKAFELDPENKSYYFQYGVTLYKSDDANRALVFLKLAVSKPDPLERDYFIGLSHFRQREFGDAFLAFSRSRSSKNPDIKASSIFYQGVTRFEEKAYDKAQPLFQEVLDTSQDPKLSERADAYIDQIIRIRQFEQERARKWAINLNVGGMYDSNVTLSSTSDQASQTATNASGYRSLLQGSFRYRPLYEVDREFAIQFDALMLRTVDTSFGFDQNLRNADPLVAGLSAPWTHKGTLWGKGHKLDIVPGVESTRMSIDNNVDKEILNTVKVGALNTLVMSDDWFTNLNFDLRKDSSLLSSSTGDNDASAIRTQVTWGNMYFLNKEKSRILISNLAYTLNQAKGANVAYDRYDIGGTYVGQLPRNFTYLVGLSYFLLSYGSNPNGRADNSVTGSLGVSRKLSERFSGSFTVSYNDNASNVAVNTWKKWTAMLTLSSGLRF